MILHRCTRVLSPLSMSGAGQREIILNWCNEQWNNKLTEVEKIHHPLGIEQHSYILFEGMLCHGTPDGSVNEKGYVHPSASIRPHGIGPGLLRVISHDTMGLFRGMANILELVKPNLIPADKLVLALGSHRRRSASNGARRRVRIPKHLMFRVRTDNTVSSRRKVVKGLYLCKNLASKKIRDKTSLVVDAHQRSRWPCTGRDPSQYSHLL